MPLLFWKRSKPEKILVKQQRTLNKVLREMEREKKRLEWVESKLISDIRKAASCGQMDTVKIMARDLVRNRRFAKKFTLLKANIQAILLKVQTTKSQFVMIEASRGVCIALLRMNRQMNLPFVARILQQFSKQSVALDLKDEMITGDVNPALEGDDDENESDAVISQVLDELGLQLSDQLSGLPHASSSICQAQKNLVVTTKTVEDVKQIVDIDADIRARLERLRRN